MRSMFVLGAGVTAILGVGLGAQNMVAKALALTKDFSGPIAVKATPLDGQTIELRMPTAQQIQDLQGQISLRSEHKTDVKSPSQE